MTAELGCSRGQEQFGRSVCPTWDDKGEGTHGNVGCTSDEWQVQWGGKGTPGRGCRQGLATGDRGVLKATGQMVKL